MQAESGRPEGRERLENLRRVRVDQVEAGNLSVRRALDLTVIASVLGDEEEQLRWFLEAARLDMQGLLYFLRDFPWLDRIRGRPEFQSWLQESEERMEAQRRELDAMGAWTPEAVLEGGAREEG